jgi:hypothetical protein
MIGIMKSTQLAVSSKQLFGALLAVSCLLLIIPTNGVHAQGDGCATASTLTPAQQTAVRNIESADPANTAASMSCQNLSADVSSDSRSRRCITGACPGGTDTMCCLPGTGADRGRGPTEPAEPGSGGGGGGPLRLQLPACIESGNCGLDDIIETGVNFANFLFGISGAIFLAIFVYAGFKYIFFASNPSEANSSKGMLVNATIGLILMFGASALVTTVYNAFRAGSSGGDARCVAAYPANSCQPLTANWEDVDARNAEIRERGCQPGLCGDDNRLVCCPASSR